MAEITKFFIVSLPLVDSSTDWLFEDPALKNDGDRIAQICGALDENGYGVDKFVRIYMGTPPGWWKKEDSKVYDNPVDAYRDAKKRLNEARKKYERGKKKKASLSNEVVVRLLESIQIDNV
jgi:hypothetical protein